MKKHLLRSLLMAIMVLSGVNAWGIEVATTYDFTTGTNGTTPTISTTAHHKAGNSTNVFLATDDICKSRFCFQAVDASSNHVFDFVNSKLQQLKGDRWFSVVDLKAGDKIAFTFTVSTGGSSTDKHFTVENAGTGTTTNLSLTKGGDAITANTDMVSGTEYYVLADGYLDFKTRKNFYLTKVVITSEVGEETVSKPELSITGANLGARTVTIKRGESSLNNTTTTYYTIDGSAPTTASTSSANQYTPVLVGEGATEEATVTVKAISVSSGNVSSEVAELAVPVGTTIQLDAPTIAVTGMALNGDVYNPVFTFTGTQSVIGKPTATLSYSIDEGAATEGVSCTVTAPGTLRVTVSAEGYASNYKDFVIKNATYTLSKTIDLSASDYVDVTGFGEGSANAHWANFGTMNATIYTLPETTSLPGITLNSVTYSQFSLGLGLGFASGTRTATINDTAEDEIGEFVLYTGGSLADEKNVSAFVEYNEGITFTLPVTGTAQALKKINVYSPKVEVPVFDPATAIKNANFEGTAIDNHLCGYGKDMSNNGTTYYGLLDIDGWQKVVVSGDNSNADYPNSGMGGAVFAYGTEYQLRGNNKTAPAEGPEGTNGKALGFFGVWGLGGYYYQDVTLPAGTYTLNIPMYNQSGTQANESYTGFFVKDSDVKYTVAVNPAVGAWTVQSVNFTLETETTGEIRVGYKSTGSGSGANPMLFIDGVQLLTELDGAKALYNTALAAANTAAANEVVTGEEKTTLNEAIAANSNIDMTSVEAVKAATSALTKAVEDFNAAKASYETLAAAKALVKLEAWPYAAAAKKTAVEEAVVAVATSAEDATAKTTALQKAYRLFVESNALAEGVEGAAICTDSIKNPAFDEGDAGWTVTNMAKTSNEPWTDSQDNSTHNYMDKWNGSSMNISVAQDVTLTAGKYVLTAIARATEGLNLILFAGEATDTLIATGNAGNVFNRGWNDVFVVFEQPTDGTINIGMKATINNQWASFSNFRLAQLEKYEAPEPVKTDYTEYIVNADLKGEGGFDATGTKGIDGSGIVKVGNAAAFDFKQTIANLPAGQYKVTAQAAYRYGADEAAEAAAIAAETDTKLVQLYATVGEKTVSSKVQNRYDGASETDYANGNGSVTVNEKFVPNSSDAVKAWFAAGQYVNEVIFNLPADGDVTIGINRTGTPESDYTVIGPWSLTRLGDAEVEPEPEPIYIETDLTAQFNSLATTQWTGSSGQVGWAAPKVKTNSGLEVAAWERYNGSCDWTGDIMSSSVTGLTPGVYKIELYGAAAFTFGRGFGSTAFTGDFTKDSSEAYSENDAITENTGVTLFAETAEGKVSKEIPIWYATNFNTSGIATATLENVIVGDAGTIKIGLSKTSTSTNWHVVQLKGVTAQVDAVELHATTLAAAQAALNAEENAIVTGDERDSLTAAITANTTVAEQTADAYKAAIAALNNAISAFTGAKAAYEDLAAAKTDIQMVNYDDRFPYASADKKAAAQATLTAEATSAADAAAKTAAIYKAYRQFAESNAMLEGIEGATNVTDSIKNPKAEDGINNWTVVKGESSGGNIDVKTNEPWTDGDDNATHNYFDGGDWGAQAWDVALQQKIALPAGKYMLTVKGRASADVAMTLFAGEEEVGIPALGATGCLFDRGWNDTSVEFEIAKADSIVIGVRGVTENQYNWMSFSDFRLYQFPSAEVIEPIEGISYSWESPAGEPIQWGGTIAYVNGDGDRLNYPNSGYYSICLNGKKANMNDEVASANAGKMVITLDNAVAAGDTIAITGYITKDTSAKSSAWIVYETGATTESEVFGDESNIYTTEGVEATGAINTKYVIVSDEAAGSKTITMTRGQTGTNLFITKLQIIEKKVATGINTLKTTFENGAIYNMNGQKVNKAQKGLYIINGKKVVIK